ncbi:insulinase family protein [Micromonospora sp. R77]|uniref:M16 family metallopeptidase n=1 Tax=Micromonospora sp. R77 TaxID=2925836 RepID=UPI001F602038|nr:pitrilysin family protein [Micromonospora sp. R77]MCI4061346.1 insulinase family protein [Micromonospora sp. R77]
MTPSVNDREVTDLTLPNGLRVLVARRPAVPLVQLRLAVPFGAAPGDDTHVAVAELLAASLLSGTARRDRATIDDELATAGAALTASVRPQRLRVSGHALAEELDTLAEVLADCLTGAAYRPDVVEFERTRLLQRVRLAGTLPEWIARAALLRHCFGDHPAAVETPDAEQVGAVTAEQVAALHATRLVPNGSVLVLVGDVDPDAAVALLAERLAGWAAPHPAVALGPPPLPTGDTVVLRHRSGAQQADVRLAAPSLARVDPGFIALRLADHVYGGYFSSRLVHRLREERGYVYTASSGIEEQAGRALSVIQFGCAPEHAWAAVDETRTLLARISDTAPPTAAEIEAARGHLAGITAISESTQIGLAEALCGVAVAGLDPRWLTRFPVALHETTDDEVRAAAQRYLRAEAYTGVLLGPEKVRPR